MFESLILLLIVKRSPNRIFLPHCVFQRKTARTNARTKTTQVKWYRLEYRLWHTPFWHVGFLIKPKTSSLAYLYTYISQNLSEVHIFLLVFGYNYNSIISGSTCILPFKITKIRLQMIPKGNTTLPWSDRCLCLFSKSRQSFTANDFRSFSIYFKPQGYPDSNIWYHLGIPCSHSRALTFRGCNLCCPPRPKRQVEARRAMGCRVHSEDKIEAIAQGAW